MLSLDNPGPSIVPSLENSGEDLENSGDKRTHDDANERPDFRTHGTGA